MQFVQFGMLGALAALAIPIIIHLMFRERERPVDLGTLQFLKVVLRENAQKRRVKRWLLLALRLACVAVIASLFARPYLLATEAVEGDRLVVLLLDRSASMGLKGTRPIDGALAEARKRIAQVGKGTRLEVALFDRAVTPVEKPADLGSTGLDPSPSGTDYNAAMAWARDLLARVHSKQKQLHVLTDLQRSGLDRGDKVTLPADVDVHLNDFGRAFPNNLSVTAVEVEPAMARPGESVTVRATVFNASALPVTKLPVVLRLDSGLQPIQASKTMDIDGRTSATIEFALPRMPVGLFRGDVFISPNDELTFDDRRYLAINVAPPLPILIIDGDPGASPVEAETYFLAAALRLAPAGERYPKSPFDVRRFNLRSSIPDLTRATPAAVVLANVDRVSDADAARLAEYVKSGRGLVVFTGDRVKAEGMQSLVRNGLGVRALVGPETTTDLPWRLERWETRHPILRPFADPEHGDLHRPSFVTITKVKPDLNARVLASFRGGDPALIEQTLGRGKILWWLTGCDRSSGNWPKGRLFVPMVHQMLAYATGLAEGGPIRHEQATADRPQGITESDGIVHVTNADPTESETARCTPKEFANRFGFAHPDPSPSIASKARDAKSTHDDRLRPDELWPWLALSLLGLMLLENYLANRTAA
jgi:hypothetical protein